MKLPVIAIIAVVLIVLVAIIAIPFIDDNTKGEDTVEKEVRIPALDAARPAMTEKATFALGWFWGPDSRFGSIEGVISTRVGYSGGTLDEPDYHRLGDHSESIEIVYDPTRISYGELLDVFWDSHNAFSQSYSTQYKSVIFYHNEEQYRQASESRDRIESTTSRKIVTEIRPASIFFQAEDYHQKYYMAVLGKLVKEMRAVYPDINDYVNSTAVARINGYAGGYGTEETLEKELDSLGLSAEGIGKLREIAGKGLLSVCPVRS